VLVVDKIIEVVKELLELLFGERPSSGWDGIVGRVLRRIPVEADLRLCDGISPNVRSQKSVQP